MTNEMLFFTVAQGLLGLLVILSMFILNSMKASIQRIATSVTALAKEQGILESRVTHNEKDTAYYRTENDGRVQRIGERTSDMRNDLERLVATIAVCPSCPSPNHTHYETRP